MRVLKDNEILQSDVADMIRNLRIEKDLTQEQLAEITGIKQSSIARLEAGRHLPGLAFLYKITSSLNKKIKISIE